MNDSDYDEEEEEIVEITEEDAEDIILLDNNGAEGFNSESEEEDQNPLSYTDNSNSPIKDDSEYVFKKHTEPLVSCALDPKNGNLAVTGGQDDKAFVWEIQQGQILFECHGHMDTVISVSFNYDGAYVATGDMSGLIQVWKVATRTLVWSDSVVGDLAWLQWHHGTNALLCAAASGEIFMWKIPSGECKVIPAHSTTPQCGVILPDGRRAAVGYADGVVKVFELKTGVVQGTIATGDEHLTEHGVSCIDANFDNNLIATGGGDGKIVLYKSQPLKVVWSFNGSHEDEPDGYAEAIGFSKDKSLPLLAVAHGTGKLYILDFAKQVIRHCLKETAGFCLLAWDRCSPVLFVSTTEGVVNEYDARNGTLQALLHGHKDTILDMCLSTDGNTLLTVSEDCTSRVFSINSPDR